MKNHVKNTHHTALIFSVTARDTGHATWKAGRVTTLGRTHLGSDAWCRAP